MQQKVELTREFRAASKIVPEAPAEAAEPDDHDDGLLATGGPIMFAAMGAALAIAAVTFLTSGEALFAVVISGVYTVIFFGIPVLMSRIRTGHDTRWRQETPHRKHHLVATFTGIMGRREAVLQMVIVPIGVAFAFAAFSMIWYLARPW